MEDKIWLTLVVIFLLSALLCGVLVEHKSWRVRNLFVQGYAIAGVGMAFVFLMLKIWGVENV